MICGRLRNLEVERCCNNAFWLQAPPWSKAHADVNCSGTADLSCFPVCTDKTGQGLEAEMLPFLLRRACVIGEIKQAFGHTWC